MTKIQDFFSVVLFFIGTPCTYVRKKNRLAATSLCDDAFATSSAALLDYRPDSQPVTEQRRKWKGQKCEIVVMTFISDCDADTDKGSVFFH